MKDIYKMLNDVKVDLDDYDEKNLDDLEKARIKKNIRKSIHPIKEIRGKRHMAIASILVGVMCMGFGGSVLASGTIMGYDLEYLLNIDKESLADYKTVINQIAVDKGIGIKLNEVVVDGQAIVLDTTIELDEPVEGHMVSASPKVYINGKQINNGITGGGHKEGETTFVSTQNIYLQDTELPEGDMDIKLVYNHVRIEGKPIRGKWAFEFTTNRDSLMKDTEVFSVKNLIKIDDKQSVYIDNVQVTPLATTIAFELGERHYDVGFDMKDQEGNEILVDSASISSEGQGIYRYEPLDETITKIIITPWYKSIPQQSGRDSNDYTYIEEASFEVKIKE